MPPTAYTESGLAEYMVTALNSMAEDLKITAASLAEAVTDTIFAYGVTDIADCTDIPRLRAIARLKAWQHALAVVSTSYDYADSGANYKRSQLLAAVQRNLQDAYFVALVFVSGSIQITPVSHVNDPYKRVVL